jgi:adenylate kinase
MPRTLKQAEMLEDMGVDVDVALSLEIADEEIERRMSSRRVCAKCGAVFSVIANPPKQERTCDKCGDKLIIRDDDQPATVRKRLEVYHAETEPIISYYRKKGKLKTVDASVPIDKVTASLKDALGF